MIELPTGPTSRGSTPSRWLGALALRTAAALCAVAGFIAGLVLLYAAVAQAYGTLAGMAALCGALVAVAASLWAVSHSMSNRIKREREIEQARELARREAEEVAAPTGGSLGSAFSDLTPWFRVVSTGAPVIAALVALFGPVKLVRLGIRAFAAWRAYERATSASKSTARGAACDNAVHR